MSREILLPPSGASARRLLMLREHFEIALDPAIEALALQDLIDPTKAPGISISGTETEIVQRLVDCKRAALLGPHDRARDCVMAAALHLGGPVTVMQAGPDAHFYDAFPDTEIRQPAPMLSLDDLTRLTPGTLILDGAAAQIGERATQALARLFPRTFLISSKKLYSPNDLVTTLFPTAPHFEAFERKARDCGLTTRNIHAAYQRLFHIFVLS